MCGVQEDASEEETVKGMFDYYDGDWGGMNLGRLGCSCYYQEEDGNSSGALVLSNSPQKRALRRYWDTQRS